MKPFFIIIIVISLILGGCATSRPRTTINADIIASADNTAGKNASRPLAEKLADNKLDLSNRQLTRVPDDVFSQTGLEELNLSGNLLTGAIQAEIRHLKNLKILRASNNLMTGVPAEIGQLENLEILDLSNNRLTGLPYELGNLKNLKTLNISGNGYSTLDLNIIVKKLPANIEIIK